MNIFFQRTLQSAVAATLLTFAMPSSSQAVDIVTRRSDNIALRGEITKMDNEQIVLKRTNGQEETVSVADLKSVQFDGEPSALNPARSTERSGALDSALTKMLDIQKNFDGSSAPAKTDLAFIIARIMGKQALTDAAKVPAAIDELNKFRTANRKNFRYLEATLLQASIQAASNQTDEARTLLTEVQNSPVKGFQLEAGVQLGRLLLASGDPAAALTAFKDVADKTTGDPLAKAALYEAMLGKALCQKQQGQLDEAIKTLNDVIAQASESETETLAEAWVRKGDCFRQKNQMKDALMAYLHVDVLYPGEPAQHAEALSRLAQLWGPGGHEDRAVEAQTRLTERYPNSPWAKLPSGG
ncbi:MAG: tetratricopeptide repeat protein [Fuerstiella sp.]|jgi:predicted negative regulator of RcsB-dependent stress response